VELLGRHDPRALVITACYFAMTKVEDDVWWLQGVARREVLGIMSLLPATWWDKMDWALRVANCEGPVDDDVWGVSPVATAAAGDGTDSGSPPAAEVLNGSVRAHIDLLAQIMHTYAAPVLPD